MDGRTKKVAAGSRQPCFSGDINNCPHIDECDCASKSVQPAISAQEVIDDLAGIAACYSWMATQSYDEDPICLSDWIRQQAQTLLDPGDNSFGEAIAGLDADELAAAQSAVATLQGQAQALVEALRAHHTFALKIGRVIFPAEGDEMPDAVEIDLSEAYAESVTCDRTIRALAPFTQGGE